HRLIAGIDEEIDEGFIDRGTARGTYGRGLRTEAQAREDLPKPVVQLLHQPPPLEVRRHEDPRAQLCSSRDVHRVAQVDQAAVELNGSRQQLNVDECATARTMADGTDP